MILVTGGSGFIGQRVVSRLADSGHKVRVLARGQRRADAQRVTTPRQEAWLSESTRSGVIP